MRILLTGGTGFVGSHLLKRLSERHEPVAIARGAPPATLRDAADWIEGDLAHLDRRRLPTRVDAVVHLAQSRRYRELPEGAADVFAVNVQSTFSLLEQARLAGCERFLFTSTGGVYRRADGPIAENAPLQPPDLYFASKCAAESLISSYRHHFSPVIFRPFFIYGPGQERMLVSKLVHRVLAGEAITLDGRRGLRTNPIYVDDLTRALEAGLETDKAGTFNLAGDEPVTLLELIELIGELSGCQPQIAFRDAPPQGDLVADNTLMRTVLGVRPKTSLRDGLSATIAAEGS